MTQPIIESRISKHRRSSRRVWVWVTALAVLLTISAGATIYWLIKPNVSAKGMPGDGVIDSIPGQTNVLVMGVDMRQGDVGRSDVMILASLDGKGKPFLLSLPRDSRVSIPGHGYDKINAAFAYGGPELSVQTASQFLGVPIDGYVVVNLEAFQEIVDVLGGVDLDVEKRMYYVDPYQDLTIDLQPGLQHLDGEKAMEYVRFRHDETGDIGRVARQQKFLQAVAKEAFSVRNIVKLPSFIKECYNAIDTNLSVTQLSKLALAGSKGYSQGLGTETLPGVGQYVGEVSYYLPDVEAARQLVTDRMLGDQDTTAYAAQTDKLIKEYDRSLQAEEGPAQPPATTGSSKPPTGSTQTGGTTSTTPPVGTPSGTTKPNDNGNNNTNPGGSGSQTTQPPTTQLGPKVELYDASGRNMAKDMAKQLTASGFRVLQAVNTTQKQADTMVVIYSQDASILTKLKAAFPQAIVVQQAVADTDVAAAVIIGTNYR